jgi:hypothetical protein
MHKARLVISRFVSFRRSLILAKLWRNTNEKRPVEYPPDRDMLHPSKCLSLVITGVTVGLILIFNHCHLFSIDGGTTNLDTEKQTCGTSHMCDTHGCPSCGPVVDDAEANEWIDVDVESDVCAFDR